MTKYVNNNGVSEMWLNIKNWVTSQLLGYSQTGHTHSASDITSGLSNVATSGSYNDLSNKPTIPSKTSDLTNDSGFLTSHQDLSGYVPRSGGAVMSGPELARNINTSELRLCGGTSYDAGSAVIVYGKDNQIFEGRLMLRPSDGTNSSSMQLFPKGTWTWAGTACQITSDQRYKQQISEIDDKLLDAWEDVDLVQFKYNDAVNEKGKDKARLHTGYVVQQINEACQKHNVDISEYGLYCHEEYPEETEEVEVEQADGTKAKERKVIREASEHYSLRYTEALIVECAYLRKKLKELTARIEQLKSSK